MARDARQTGLDARSGSGAASLRMAIGAFQRFPDVPLEKLKGARWSTAHYRKSAQDYEKTFTKWKTENLAN